MTLAARPKPTPDEWGGRTREDAPRRRQFVRNCKVPSDLHAGQRGGRLRTFWARRLDAISPPRHTTRRRTPSSPGYRLRL
jgi:hypothetical protein